MGWDTGPFADLTRLAMQPAGTERDAAAIRAGFQIRPDGSYTRTTGLPYIAPEKVIPFVPLVGPSLSAVVTTVGAIKQPTVTPSRTLEEPGAIAAPTPGMASASAPAAARGGGSLDTNTMLVFGLAALALLLLVRR